MVGTRTVLILLAAAFIILLLIIQYEHIYQFAKKLRNTMKPVSGKPNYNTYHLSVLETFFYLSAAGIAVFAAAIFFYRSLPIAIILTPLAFFYPRIRAAELANKRKNQLLYQFKESLYLISASLQAGKSIEMCFVDARRDLAIQYPDPQTYIIVEYDLLNQQVDMNEPIENVLMDMAHRSGLDEIRNFADVFSTCKRTGGNLIQVVRSTAEIINEKIEVKQEIDTLLAERKFEQKILMAMPIVVILMISASSEDFIWPIFNTIPGKIAMTTALILMAAAYVISEKIMDIEV